MHMCPIGAAPCGTLTTGVTVGVLLETNVRDAPKGELKLAGAIHALTGRRELTREECSPVSDFSSYNVWQHSKQGLD